jgi:hypothetical protein
VPCKIRKERTTNLSKLARYLILSHEKKEEREGEG